MLTVLAFASIGSTLATTKVVTRKIWSQCTTDGAQFGSSQVATSVKNGCSNMGYADCAGGYFLQNSTDGLLACANMQGDRLNTTNTCQLGNYTLTCADIDGTKAAEVTLWTGSNCNGTALPFGVVTINTCTYLASSKYVKMWANATGNFVATYSAAECAGASQLDIANVGSSSASSGCAAGVLGSGYATVKWALLEVPSPTAPPTVAGNSTNTTAPGSSSTVVMASLASVVVAAASLMM
jgi:hypothetical protein